MKVKLESFLQEVSEKTTENNQYQVLTSSKVGLYLQSDYFNKQVASKDNKGYKIIKKGQFTYRAMSDTGEFFPNMLECTDIGIVSPAYPVFEIVKPVIIPEYLKYYFKSNGFQQSISSFAQGSTRTSIKYGKLKTVSMDLPNLEEQKRVIAILDTIHNIIDSSKQELKMFDDLIKARFVELFGDPANNEKGFIKAPMGDYMTLLTDFSSNGSYKTLDSGVTMYDEPNYAWMVRTTDLESGDMTSIKYIDESAYALLSKSKIYGGEIIMNKIGSAGKIYLMPQINMPASLGRNAFMFRYDERINVKFLYHLLTSDYGKREIQQYVRGAVTKTITKNDARAVLIIVPPIELQNEFEVFVEQVDKSKLMFQKLHQKLNILQQKAGDI